ncbi:alpha/beta hydrolase [Sphingomonas sabuli]|uniref:Alpha/beta hydrolase n=2 Tax=Sphingomonas sabuli TaxID=2764186 RepID=A0A7G9L5W4_9SPHN|nr:alpha/beta hydrolase [Sphingomonas sabuli]
MLSAMSTMVLGGCSPAGLLNGASRLVGDSARLAGSGIPFGDDPRLKLDVWAPNRAPAEPLPVVVFFYGGGWAMGDRAEYGFAGRALAARGFVCVIPDYRLVPNVRFPAFVEDGARAMKWVADNIAGYGGDPSRVAVSGHSAGSYIAAMLALDPHFLRDAGADPKLIRAAALLSGPYDFYPFTENRGRDALANWPRPQETQPITFARKDAPPMLLMHGTADTVVQPRNSRALAAALTKAGAVAETRFYEGKSHIDTIKSLSPLFRGSTPALDDMIAFLARYDQAGA